MSDDSIFGDLDLDDVADDPWAIDPGTYRCVVTACDTQDKPDEDGEIIRTLKITYHIDETASKFHGRQIQEFFSYFPRKKVEDLEPKQAQRLSFMKVRIREAFDVTKEGMKTWKPMDSVGKTVYVTTKNNSSNKEGDDRKFVNVTKAISERLFQEQGGEVSAAGAATGASLGI